MSFLNPTPIPVTLYSSDDQEAPQLGANDWTGAIKTILKACLVTGYGGKQGMGWAMTDETDHQATFTPTDPQAPPVGITMDSSNRHYSQFDLVWQGVAQGITVQNPARLNRLINGNWTWKLVASARGFAFIPIMQYTNYPVSGSLLYFGASNSNLRDPQGQDFVCLSAYGYQWTGMSLLRNYLYSANRAAWVTGDLKKGGKIGDGRSGVLWAATGIAANRSGGRKWAEDALPMQSRLYSEIMVHNDSGLIGKIPGLLVASHRIASDNDGDIVQIDGSPHRWLYSDQLDQNASPLNSGGIGLLVNLDEWMY